MNKMSATVSTKTAMTILGKVYAPFAAEATFAKMGKPADRHVSVGDIAHIFGYSVALKFAEKVNSRTSVKDELTKAILSGLNVCVSRSRNPDLKKAYHIAQDMAKGEIKDFSFLSMSEKDWRVGAMYLGMSAILYLDLNYIDDACDKAQRLFREIETNTNSEPEKCLIDAFGLSFIK